MRHLFLATTALAALALPAQAAAQTAPSSGPVRLGLGGYFQFYGVAGWQDDDPGHPGEHRHNLDWKREAEIFFTGQAKLDDGLVVGVDVQLEAESCSDQIDESYVWFQGAWGRVNLGAENSAAYLLAAGPPVVDASFDGQDPLFILYNRGATNGDPRIGSAGFRTTIDFWIPLASGDSEKITWLSPRLAGFRLGVSFTPDNSEEGTQGGQVQSKGGSFAGMPLDETETQWSNLVALGISYEEKLGPFEVLAGAGWEIGFLEGDETQTVGGFTSRYKDRNAWTAGATLGYGGFELGGAYFADDNGIDCTFAGGACGGSGTQRSWGLGLSYAIGPWTVGASYLHSARNRDPVGRAERLERYMAGIRYALGRGVDLRGSVQHYDYETALSALDTENDNRATFLVLGTVLTF